MGDEIQNIPRDVLATVQGTDVYSVVKVIDCLPSLSSKVTARTSTAYFFKYDLTGFIYFSHKKVPNAITKFSQLANGYKSGLLISSFNWTAIR